MKIIAVIGVIGMILLVALVASAPSIAEYVAFRKLSPTERAKMKAEYRDWKTKKLTLPADALEAKPFSAETQAASRTLVDIWEKNLKENKELVTKFQSSPKKGAPQEDEAALKQAMEKLQPLLDAFIALVQRPDYLNHAVGFAKIHEGGSPPLPIYGATNACTRMLALQARRAAREGRLDEALGKAETIVRAAKADRYGTILSQMVGIAISHEGSRVWGEVVEQCNDPATLRRTLEAQNKLVPQLDFLSDGRVSLPVLDQLGMIREFKQRGVAVEYQNLTAREITAKVCDAQAAYMESKILPAVRNDPALTKVVEQRITGTRGMASSMGGAQAGLVTRQIGRITEPMLYKMVVPNFMESRTRAKMARTEFDLLRLATARKLYTLEKGKAPASIAELVPAYLPELPEDHFAPKKAAYKETGEIFYSLGPDGKDQKNAITYDPSNGTTSAGDIALAR